MRKRGLSMHIETVLREARTIWGDKPMSLDHIVIALGVVYGDLCRQARNQKEGGQLSEAELKKEMGNLIFSLVRWCDDLGFDPEECIQLAKVAQADYIKKKVQQ